jgi:hypothetical protein
MYAHEAVLEWDKMMDAPDDFLIMCSFPDFVADYCEDKWYEWAEQN